MLTYDVVYSLSDIAGMLSFCDNTKNSDFNSRTNP